MTNRNDELKMIDEFVENNEVQKGPVAFATITQQALVPVRDFTHSIVVKKFRIGRGIHWFKKGGK